MTILCVKCGKTYASFGLTGESPTHCNDCRDPEMVNLNSKKCILCNEVRSSFGIKNSLSGATHCNDCKLPGMVNVVSKMCIVCNETQPSFGIKNSLGGATHCNDCKLPGMVNVVSKMCIVCNEVRPNFGIKNSLDGATHCNDCKLTGMVNVKDKRCIVCNETIPKFGIKNSLDGATHCNDCKLPEMTDLRHKKCILCEKTRPSYGFVGQQATHCAKDKIPGMYTRPNRQCEEDDCKETALWGTTEPLHCETHSKPPEIFMCVQTCQNCNRVDILNNEGLCITFCKPDAIYQRRKREKKFETQVLKYLDEHLVTDIVPVDDMIIDSNCNKKRPDRLYDTGTHVVIVEVDENQHSSYEPDCELLRMHQLYEAAGLPCIFLRYNPNNYRVNGFIKKTPLKKRLETLTRWVKYCIDTPSILGDAQIKYKYLFYDDYDETDTDFITFTYMDL